VYESLLEHTLQLASKSSKVSACLENTSSPAVDADRTSLQISGAPARRRRRSSATPCRGARPTARLAAGKEDSVAGGGRTLGAVAAAAASDIDAESVAAGFQLSLSTDGRTCYKDFVDSSGGAARRVLCRVIASGAFHPCIPRHMHSPTTARDV